MRHRVFQQDIAPTRVFRAARSGITLMELLVSIWILAILIGLLVVGLRASNHSVSSSADQQAARVLRIGIEQFKQSHGFLPPLVRDNPGPPLNGSVIDVYLLSNPTDLAFLRTKPNPSTTADPRFSIYTLGLYLFGPLDEAIDGRTGPGFFKPNVDGSFDLTKKRVYEPVVDGSRGMKGLVPAEPLGEGRFEVVDRHGNPFRYYRWERDAVINLLPDDLNVPDILGDPSLRVELRQADYAIVGAGPDEFFGDPDENLSAMAAAVGVSASDPARVRAKAREDNVVEIGTK